jgi:hypothetical protein
MYHTIALQLQHITSRKGNFIRILAKSSMCPTMQQLAGDRFTPILANHTRYSTLDLACLGSGLRLDALAARCTGMMGAASCAASGALATAICAGQVTQVLAIVLSLLRNACHNSRYL